MKNNHNRSKKQHSFDIPKPVIFFGKFLQFFSKDLAARYAARLFAFPYKFKTPERELMMRDSAKNERFKMKGNNTTIQVYVYGYSKVKVLLVHGWAGRGTQLYQLADKILENKMMVISIDAPAHGLSTGKRTNMLEYIETIRQINEKYGPFEAAVGHSFGGMSLINAVADGLKIKKLVTIGADNSIPLIFKYAINKMELKPVINERLQSIFEKRHHLKIDSLTSEHKAKKINIPTFIIHDSEDKFVNVRSAINIRQSLQHGELLITHGLGHHKIFKNNFVIQRIIEFIK